MSTTEGFTSYHPPAHHIPIISEVQSLFSTSLIPTEVVSSLPNGYTIRPLSRDDYAKGFFDCLRVLTWVGDPTEAEFTERFDEMVEAKGTYYFVVIEYEGCIVGTGCLVVERKFIHNRSKCGHIEEISIAKEYQGKGLGLKIMEALDSVAVAVGCSKSILNCGPRNEPFYVKCGYENTGVEMTRTYVNDESE
ncbi:Uu.00g029910.m01.CDS01 [Anthostomella pinea]|uniref:Glucosamine 6-phosphate N-acetyltransferase n=1 Tax=Anthostomella pinea TaxID=933095 RepID=A0AAI8V3C4_9PEZI|nr:Uu.00g029910.m01.CDS01 [Anthostomella pinea]